MKKYTVITEDWHVLYYGEDLYEAEAIFEKNNGFQILFQFQVDGTYHVLHN